MNEWLYWKPAVLKEKRMLFHISRKSVFFVNCEKWVPINSTLVWKARQPPMSPKGRVFLFYRNSHSAAHQGRSLQTWEHYETLIRFCLLGLLMLVPRKKIPTSYQKIPLTLLFCLSMLKPPLCHKGRLFFSAPFTLSCLHVCFCDVSKSFSVKISSK